MAPYCPPSCLAALDKQQEQKQKEQQEQQLGPGAGDASAVHAEQLREQLSARGLTAQQGPDLSLAEMEELLEEASPTAGGSSRASFGRVSLASIEEGLPAPAAGAGVGAPADNAGACQGGPPPPRASCAGDSATALSGTSSGTASSMGSGASSPASVLPPLPGAGGGSAGRKHHRSAPPRLHRPTPIRGTALVEARRRRKQGLASTPLSFDPEALRADPDGSGGKAWRKAQEQAGGPPPDPYGMPLF